MFSFHLINMKCSSLFYYFRKSNCVPTLHCFTFCKKDSLPLSQHKSNPNEHTLCSNLGETPFIFCFWKVLLPTSLCWFDYNAHIHNIHILIFINKLSRLLKLIGSFFFLIIRKLTSQSESLWWWVSGNKTQNIWVAVRSNKNLVLLHKLIIWQINILFTQFPNIKTESVFSERTSKWSNQTWNSRCNQHEPALIRLKLFLFFLLKKLICIPIIAEYPFSFAN